MGVQDRVALVNGGSRGLGLQVVRSLAACGMRVVLGSRSVERGRVAVAQLGDLADQVAARQLDSTDPASVAHLALWLDRALGRCDVLVNNAGGPLLADGAAADTDLDLAGRALARRVLGTWRVSQAIVPLMLLGGYGRIVNIAGPPGGFPLVGRQLAVTRVIGAAIGGLTRTLAGELVGRGVLVNACGLDPDPDTPVWLATLPDDGPTGGFYRGRSPLDW